ncbi:hypothetical protein BKA70DRAFT_1304437 [Coprinopsis sp. MPI-PUGE-AT-0042]|nr:hypothetical protein BKA70DRAFT_1304437 [Coprinopsis sp. MPI-PUGE-AT-0042]
MSFVLVTAVQVLLVPAIPPIPPIPFDDDLPVFVESKQSSICLDLAACSAHCREDRLWSWMDGCRWCSHGSYVGREILFHRGGGLGFRAKAGDEMGCGWRTVLVGIGRHLPVKTCSELQSQRLGMHVVGSRVT